MSLLREIDIKLKEAVRSIDSLVQKVSDDSNIFFSQGEVTSVADDLTYCNVFLVDKGRTLEEVMLTIPCHELNLLGHLSVGDTVLVGYNYGFMSPFIVKKMSTTIISEDYAMNLTNRIDLSILTI